MSTSRCPCEASGRHPFSVSSACHAHPDARAEAAEIAARPACTLDHAFRTQGRALLQFLRRQVGSEEAPDLFQEVFTRAAGSSQRHSLVNPGGFLRRIAQNLLIDRARQVGNRPPAVALFDEESISAPPEQEWAIVASDLVRQYEQAVAAMPPKTRRVFLMHRVDELTYREIHRAIGISEATVEYHMRKALDYLAIHVDLGE